MGYYLIKKSSDSERRNFNERSIRSHHGHQFWHILATLDLQVLQIPYDKREEPSFHAVHPFWLRMRNRIETPGRDADLCVFLLCPEPCDGIGRSGLILQEQPDPGQFVNREGTRRRREINIRNVVGFPWISMVFFIVILYNTI